MMKKLAILALVAALLGSYRAHGQQMTEKYIPVGAYPALAGKLTILGTIAAVDEPAGTITLSAADGDRIFQITGGTRIWLDRSLLGQPNMDGALTDVGAGLKAEVSAMGPEQAGVARWVKVQIPSSR
ncbi:MAG TPA: hypothetical protein VGB25_00725 [Candidatus Binatia bacterium]